MKQLESSEVRGELMSETAQRLIEWGCTEGQSQALANIVRLTRSTTDTDVEAAVIGALVSAKYAVDGVPEIEYVSGIRRDTLRLEGR
jgi:hypothetical protein